MVQNCHYILIYLKETTILKYQGTNYKHIQTKSGLIRLFLICCILGSGLFTTQNVIAVENQITLNLKQADIRALISTVSKFTGKNFVVDPRVKAKVTVVSSNTMSESEVYEVFLSVLQVHGYAAVPVGNIIKIVPQVNAKQGPLPVVRGSKNRGDQLITKVITLDHVPAAQLVPILRPLVPQQGHLAAYNPTNTLIVTDHAANIKRLVQIIRHIDRPESDELEIIPLKHASASELVRILNSLQSGGIGAKSPSTKKITLAADDRTNSILMSGERSSRLKIRATIAHLDTPLQNEAGNTHVIYLKYAKAKDIVTILTGVQKNQSKTTKKTSKAITSTKKADVDIQADEATNSLIITAGPDVVRRMKSIIRQLDIRRAQVLVESIIAEISNNTGKEFSSQFVVGPPEDSTSDSVPIGVGNFGGAGGIIGLFSGDASTIGSSIGDGITFGFGSDGGTRFAFLLKALSSDAATNILSTPSVVTLDNQEATIVIAQNVPFLTGSFTTAADGASNPFQTVERQDVGITLKVTPQINDGNTIKLEIDQEVSNVSASAAANGGIVTNKRQITTSVLVEDGEILVLGGLIDDTLRDTVSKVPILGDIPLLGWLFRSHTTSKEKQNLMIFMRPSIMRDAGAAAYHTNQKYNYLRAQQISAGENGFGLLKDEKNPLLPPLQNLVVPEDASDEKLRSPLNKTEADNKNETSELEDEDFE
ncbi:MAG: type II secretion system protein GspD [endosymbiont of Galathealinum brachiosum]|uniref:Type II secretion system protein GspD n=1 Tax=endosymbiont of Galathealinum brachiosum TaxID=2200906 RepID=A0A370DES5_9GAMM|nr:MAG: type II secretion system protein GspD [endosymbiont of Galathealinum brachiosum]